MLMGPLIGYGRALVQRPPKHYGCRHIKKRKDSRRGKKRRKRKNGR